MPVTNFENCVTISGRDSFTICHLWYATTMLPTLTSIAWNDRFAQFTNSRCGGQLERQPCQSAVVQLGRGCEKVY